MRRRAPVNARPGLVAEFRLPTGTCRHTACRPTCAWTRRRAPAALLRATCLPAERARGWGGDAVSVFTEGQLGEAPPSPSGAQGCSLGELALAGMLPPAQLRGFSGRGDPGLQSAHVCDTGLRGGRPESPCPRSRQGGPGERACRGFSSFLFARTSLFPQIPK